jgi:CRISPR/Cas system-associated exonuclease Cas4 (RecB family)
MLRVILSSSAAIRFDAARAFLDKHSSGAELLIVGASRGAADDLARGSAAARGATFGLHRFSLTQLAARLAAPSLARGRLAPTTPLGVQAVAARVLFESAAEGSLAYFHDVASAPGFPRALARTLEELALADASAADLRRLPHSGRDLADLYERFEAQFEAASAVDRARFFNAATQAAASPDGPYVKCPLLLLDVPIAGRTERALVEALVNRSSDACATVPAGDAATRDALQRLGDVQTIEPSPAKGLDRIRQYVFAAAPPPPGEPLEEVDLFSAPGEGRECVEIARRVLAEARRGVPFDRMAIAVRAPQQYAALLEHALRRAGVPAYFDRGTRRPHPAGRAYLALLRCAIENLSAARFAEYLSLGQVPDRVDDGPTAGEAFPASSDEVFGALADREPPTESADEEGVDGAVRLAAETDARSGHFHSALRAPWKWERLLAESKVVTGEQRWTRRLKGLVGEFELQRREAARTEPDSARVSRLAEKIADTNALASFALPVVRTLAAWPARALWREWLDHFSALAPRVLKRPDRVLRVLADLTPMGAIGPVDLEEAADVLTERLTSIEADPPARRYGRVFVASPAQLRGRCFDVVFVPSLAERMFPQRPREDPLLLDGLRVSLDPGLTRQDDRAELEKLQLRLAIGAARQRLYVSFPTVEIGEGRPRVPSLYALEIWRAMTGRVPGADELKQIAARASQASLAWPAPAAREEAIDALEHDLATLRGLIGEPDERSRGRAQYILRLNESLARSVRERFMRGKRAWSHWDGLTRTADRIRPTLMANRLTARPYSVSSLQKYSACPYQFLLAAIFRLQPADDLEPLQRMDPLTRGSIFHEMQTLFYRRLKSTDRLPVTLAGRDAALEVLEDVVDQVSSKYHEELAPAIERVWEDEIASIRRDLRLWVDEIARPAGGDGGHDGWIPRAFEWAFGLTELKDRDPDSRREPVAIDGRFLLHGSIDLVEEHPATGELRVTDHKTGKYRGKDHMIVNGGESLQPVLYSLALEAATGRPVIEGRLYYTTVDGGFKDARIPLTPVARRVGVEVLEIIDRAVDTGFLAPAPREKACTWCDFRPVCGPNAEWRSTRIKAQDPLADLLALRRKP